ncbi:hypothetical protein C5167_002214 [Papaver somniferum]|uniref:Uncharacterized protein n=1 Tax=Papaver somniferum TaxID=3469 RepID=A0A4Y7L072_PAPSO|nr:hypothetical protein C5167_002214 [Papaver somniferum]
MLNASSSAPATLRSDNNHHQLICMNTTGAVNSAMKQQTSTQLINSMFMVLNRHSHSSFPANRLSTRKERQTMSLQGLNERHGEVALKQARAWQDVQTLGCRKPYLKAHHVVKRCLHLLMKKQTCALNPKYHGAKDRREIQALMTNMRVKKSPSTRGASNLKINPPVLDNQEARVYKSFHPRLEGECLNPLVLTL